MILKYYKFLLLFVVNIMLNMLIDFGKRSMFSVCDDWELLIVDMWVIFIIFFYGNYDGVL